MTEQQALQKLAALCSTAEHCQGEMLEKLRKWEIEEAAQARIMQWLIEQKFVDDERFCRAFVNDKIKYNKWGRRKIEQALWQKRIDSDLARRVLDEVSDDDYLAVLRPLLKSKAKSIKAKDDYEFANKLIRFAAGRGFTFDIIRQCIDHADEFLNDD